MSRNGAALETLLRGRAGQVNFNHQSIRSPWPSTCSTSRSIVTSSRVLMTRIRPCDWRLATSESGRQLAFALASNSRPKHSRPTQAAARTALAVFANAGREYQSVDAAQRRGQSANRLSDSMHVNGQCQLGALMTGVRCFQHVAHVRRQTRHPQQARFVIQGGLDLFRGESVVLLNVQDNARIDGAAARAHHQTFQGRKPHGRIEATSSAHRGCGATVAEMTDNEPQFLGRPVEQLRGRLQ